ncbi:MAG: FkbM family methyltransferase [Chthonomonas sp.]|nr:FkbM family methyltransferase [Chthonomonas sp.]
MVDSPSNFSARTMGKENFYWTIRNLAKKCYRAFVPREGDKERLAFYKQFISRDDVVFDIGANMGNRTRIFLRLGARVVAVEPQHKCCMSLRSEFGDRIHLFEGGAGKEVGVKKFYANESTVLSSFSEDWIETMKESGRSNDAAWSAPVELQMTTLDKLIEQHGVPKFIKIDVEGYELEVLSGLTQPAEMISFEYTVPESLSNLIACLQRVSSIYADDVEFNYAVAENMSFESDSWLSADDIIKIMSADDFAVKGSGDVYVRRRRTH